MMRMRGLEPPRAVVAVVGESRGLPSFSQSDAGRRTTTELVLATLPDSYQNEQKMP